MAVGLLIKFDNLTVDDYEAVSRVLDFPAQWPEGLIAHGALVVDGRLRLYDVWEAREDFDAWVGGRLGAAMGEALGERAEQPQVSEAAFHAFHTRP